MGLMNSAIEQVMHLDDHLHQMHYMYMVMVDYLLP